MAGAITVLDPSDLHLLPSIMRQLALEIGLVATLKLVEKYGGVYIYIPIKFHSNEAMMNLVGEEAFLLLVSNYGGQRLEIARCVKACRYLVYREILSQSTTLTQRQLALKYNLTTRTIRNYEMRGELPDKNHSLF